MKRGMNYTKATAELVGLWLAEGDRKSIREITITNNCFDLIRASYKTLTQLFNANNFRIYVYLPKKGSMAKNPLPTVITRYYVDLRARKPYYILRLANTQLVRQWKAIVAAVCRQERLYGAILRGVFAGEGNIKTGSHCNRMLRIAQKNPLPVIDGILNHFNVEWQFLESESGYVISGRQNWQKLARIRIADLHPIKKKRFWAVYNSYVQWHYKNHHIQRNILSHLNEPKSSAQLARYFKRSQARLQRVLCHLKNEGKIQNYVVQSRCYWVKSDSNLILISKRKKMILGCLMKPLRTFQIARAVQIDGKSALRRLRELKRLGLVSRNDYYWYTIPTSMKVRVCE